MLRIRTLTIALCVFVLLCSYQPVAHERPAPRTEVDVAIVLAVDVSESVSAKDFALQLKGYAAAFRHPDVIRAIQRGGVGAIAVTMTQWASFGTHAQTVPWTYINGIDSAATFASKVEYPNTRLFSGMTSISGAILFAVHLLDSVPYEPLRRVIDISGDGTNNDGPFVREARAEALSRGITINGLPILAEARDIERYYQSVVIGGPGSFLVLASSMEDFERAVRRKLIMEIADARR